MPWARLAKDLALAYGWTPEEVGKLTLYQAAMFAGLHTPDDGPRRISREEALSRGLIRLAKHAKQ